MGWGLPLVTAGCGSVLGGPRGCLRGGPRGGLLGGLRGCSGPLLRQPLLTSRSDATATPAQPARQELLYCLPLTPQTGSKRAMQKHPSSGVSTAARRSRAPWGLVVSEMAAVCAISTTNSRAEMQALILNYAVLTVVFVWLYLACSSAEVALAATLYRGCDALIMEWIIDLRRQSTRCSIFAANGGRRCRTSLGGVVGRLSIQIRTKTDAN